MSRRPVTLLCNPDSPRHRLGLNIPWLALLGAASLTSCSAILDFEALQGSVGVELDGGSPGPDPEDCEEADDDPCTVPQRNGDGECEELPLECEASDTECMVSQCEDGQCVDRPIEGLQALGEPRVARADKMWRSTTEPTVGGFVVAAFGEVNGVNDISLSYLENSEEWQQPPNFPGLLETFGNARSIAAAPAIILNELANPPRLDVYFPIVTDCDAYSQMVIVRLPPDLRSLMQNRAVSAELTDQPNFLTASPRVGVAAGRAEGQAPFVAWLGGDGNCDDPAPETEGIYFQTGDNATIVGRGPSIAERRDVTGIAALNPSADGRGVVWSVDTLEPLHTEVFTRFFGVAGDEGPVFSCPRAQNANSEQLSVSPLPLNSWATSWSQRGFSDDVFSANTVSEFESGGAQDATCPYAASIAAGQGRRPLIPGAVATQAFVYVDGLRTIIDQIVLSTRPTAESSETAIVEATVRRVEVGGLAGAMNFGDAVELARLDVSLAPDWPEIAVSEDGYVAASWIQRRDDGGGEELRTQQLRLCR